MLSSIQQAKSKFQLVVFWVFVIVLVKVYVYMIKKIVKMQYLSSLEMFEIMNFELEHDQMIWIKKYEFKFV